MKQYSKKDLKDFDIYLTNLLVNALKDFKSKYKFIPASIYNDCDSEEAAIKKWNSILDTMINDFSFYGKDIDIIQVGTRNMYNYELLKELGKLNKPVLLKRGFMATYKEWLFAAEYILKEGNYNVILCERGIRGFDSSETRNVLDLQAIPFIKKYCNLPIIVDPSHSSGKDYIVKPMSKAALIAGADGLIIEVHTNPSSSLCDSEQTIDIDELKEIIKFKERIDIYEN